MVIGKLNYTYLSVRVTLAIGLVLMLSGCSGKPKNVLSENKMVSLVADLELAESYFRMDASDSYDENTKSAVLEGILQKHGLTKAEFDSTMTWYGKNSDVYQKLLEKVDRELSDRQARIVGETPLEETITDMWPYQRHFGLNSISNSDNLSFSVGNSDLIPGERIKWNMNLNKPHEGNLMLGVEYDNGVSHYSYQNLYGQKKLEITLQTDTAHRVKRFFGLLRFANLKRETVFIDSVMLGKLPFDSTQYYRIFSQRKRFPPQLKRAQEGDTISNLKLNPMEKDGAIEAEESM